MIKYVDVTKDEEFNGNKAKVNDSNAKGKKKRSFKVTDPAPLENKNNKIKMATDQHDLKENIDKSLKIVMEKMKSKAQNETAESGTPAVVHTSELVINCTGLDYYQRYETYFFMLIFIQLCIESS